MKILDAHIKWNESCENLPDLEVLVDKIPHKRTLLWYDELVPLDGRPRPAYWTEREGYVAFHVNPGTDGALGGRITLAGSRQVVDTSGSWSSRAGAMRKYVPNFPACINVAMTDDKKRWEGRGTLVGGHITLELARAALKLSPDPACLVEADLFGKGEWCHVISAQGNRLVKPSGKGIDCGRKPIIRLAEAIDKERLR
jgi:hypothetical protein